MNAGAGQTKQFQGGLNAPGGFPSCPPASTPLRLPGLRLRRLYGTEGVFTGGRASKSRGCLAVPGSNSPPTVQWPRTRLSLPLGGLEALRLSQNFPRALHAHVLGFYHPERGTWEEFVAPLARDLEELLRAIKAPFPDSGD